MTSVPLSAASGRAVRRPASGVVCLRFDGADELRADEAGDGERPDAQLVERGVRGKLQCVWVEYRVDAAWHKQGADE